MNQEFEFTPDVIEKLAAPFPVNELKWRALNWSEGDKSAMAFAYIDARAVMDRLDEVVGPNWGYSTEVILTPAMRAVVRATLNIGSRYVDGIGEADVRINDKGDISNDPWKSAESDALKRAAVSFGIGRYLYSLPTLWLDWNGTRYSGGFAVNPTEIVFNEDGTVKDSAIEKSTRKGATKTTAKIKVAAPPTKASVPTPPTSDGEEEDPFDNTPSTPTPPAAVKPIATAPAPPTTKKPTLGNDIDECQGDWLADVYESAGAELPDDLRTWTRKQAAQHIFECIEAGGNTTPPTAAQLELVSKLSTQIGAALPADLAGMTKQTTIKFIQELSKAAANK